MKLNILSIISIITIHILTLMLLFAYHPLIKQKVDNSNLQIMILFSLLGMTILLSANNFLIFYIGLELQSLALYSMAAINRDVTKSSEAGLKYFILGAFASCILLYGISLVYGYSGSVIFNDIFKFLENSLINNTPNLAFNVGIIFIIASLLFKAAIVPFHMWITDVYEGSPTIVTSFFAVIAKFTAIIVLINILFGVFAPYSAQLDQFLMIMAVASIALGAFGAIIQHNVKRLFAYSAISQAGFIVLGLACCSELGLKAALSYIFAYVITTLGIFSCLMLNRQRVGHNQYNIADLAGLSKNEPFIAFAMLVFVLSFAGIPPFAMFFTKLNIFRALIGAQYYSYAIITILVTVASTYYYLNIIKVMYFDSLPINHQVKKVSCKNVLETKFVISVCLLFNIAYIILPSYIFNYIFYLIDSLAMSSMF